MANNDYTHGEMDVQSQTDTWEGFIKFSTWGGLITILMVGYATLAIAIGMNWMISLGLMAALGLAVGVFMDMGGRWMATLVGLIILALLVQGFILLFGTIL